MVGISGMGDEKRRKNFNPQIEKNKKIEGTQNENECTVTLVS